MAMLADAEKKIVVIKTKTLALAEKEQGKPLVSSLCD